MNLKYEAKVTSIEISQEDVILLTKILSKCKRKKQTRCYYIIKNTKDIEWMNSLVYLRNTNGYGKKEINCKVPGC